MMAVKNYYAYVHGGLRLWFSSVEAPNAASPLTSALASLLLIITGPRVAFGIYIPLLAGIATVVAIYYIAKQSSIQRVAEISALVVATTPLLVNYSRSFHFAIPATACTTVALLCLIKSEQAKRWPWIIAFGFFVGLMPLARTMTLAFIPCLGLAAFVYVVASPDERLARIGRLFVAGAVASATALTWLFLNGKYVSEYLFNFGYGARAAEFGPKLSFIGSVIYMIQIFLDQVYAPHFIVISVGIAISIFLLLKNLLRSDRNEWLSKYASSPITPVSLFVFFSFLILSSSQNKGTAFIAPLLPPTIFLSTWAIFRLSDNRFYGIAVASALAFISMYAFIPMVDLNSETSTRTTHWLPFYGKVVYSDGSGTMQGYEAAFGINTAEPGKALPPETAEAWNQINQDTLDAIGPFIGATRAVAFGFRNAVYNVNTLGLTNSLRGQPPLNLFQIEPLITGESAEGYLAWFASGPAAPACVLLSSPGEKGEFPPYVNTVLVESAAKQSGFVAAQTLSMPSGRVVTIWRRPC
ncbi:ArnT family glycosyltransferase [Rhizobium ruizarguesonis]|uniref:ArnT family glycosyltransferase n=1 Tax=Rhizobium ruizarguesonis TaxID=2081791 RepID=UPI00371AF735